MHSERQLGSDNEGGDNGVPKRLANTHVLTFQGKVPWASGIRAKSNRLTTGQPDRKQPQGERHLHIASALSANTPYSAANSPNPDLWEDPKSRSPLRVPVKDPIGM